MIYLLSLDLEQSAEGLCDTHLNETILDAARCASYYLWETRQSDIAFDASLVYNSKNDWSKIETNIPRAFYPLKGQRDLFEWVLQSPSNYTLLVTYLIRLIKEYEYRFYKLHKVAYILHDWPTEKFEEQEWGEELGRKILACTKRYQKPEPHWVWTNRKPYNDVI